MKFAVTLAIIIATYIVPSIGTAATQQCLHNLNWQREGYTKSHINVTESIKQINPKPVQWTRYDGHSKQYQCLMAISTAKTLRLAEDKRWSKLRLQRPGVRWIIRRQFQSAGSIIVDLAWKVASCESSYIYNRISSTGDYGVWQINQIHHVPESITFSPELSTAWAWRASDHGKNFSPTWVCATRLGIA